MTKETIEETPLEGLDPGLEEVFRLVYAREGIDFRSYRRKTIERRVTSRFQKLRCQSYEEYATVLASDPAESHRLIEHVTIKVSRFFRDAPVYSRLRDEVLPELLRLGASRGEIRFWSAGCGCGEESYSLAILVQEMASRGLTLPQVSIMGTDLDEGALILARRGSYAEAALTEASPEAVATYFTRGEGRTGPQYEVLPGLRQSVTFLRHDLLAGTAPVEGLLFDLLMCRNVLIYFDRPAQEQVLRLLTASITSGGYLCLGEAEHLPSGFMSEFKIIDRQARLYRKA